MMKPAMFLFLLPSVCLAEPRILWTPPETGIVSVVNPLVSNKPSDMTTEEYIHFIAEKDIPGDPPYEIIDSSELPEDRYFRNAWVQSGDTISVDRVKAEKIQKEKIDREVKAHRKAIVEDLIEAEAVGDAAAKAEAERKLQELKAVESFSLKTKDAPTLEDLKARWPEAVPTPKPD